ncbi:MAG TPA: ATP-dependent DNA helicase RecG, partial [Flavobacteriales bacterium]|nr:ATP-dependent DNA helicase RecG [Flavobacteriales bacterium]
QYIQKKIRLNETYIVFGKPTLFNRKFNIAHPELETVAERQQKAFVKLQPVYPSTELLSKKGFNTRLWTQIMTALFKETGLNFKESLPEDVRSDLKLLDKNQALFNIHFPQNIDLLHKAQTRLKFEELFYLQLQLLQKNIQHKQKIKGHIFEVIGDYFNRFYKDILPFDLTNAQKRVIKEIRADVRSGAQMNRLLQGDVGSGKTIVAFLSMLMAVDNGYQAALLAPTEILAQQHYEGLRIFAEELGLQIKLLTGSTKQKERKEIAEKLLSGELHFLVGTHAILEDKVQFKNLGLAIIDEQHRFGVAQRGKMWRKNTIPPHILVMTATPIPRTLAMTHYGDLDFSVIDELPPGRKPVQTIHRYRKDKLKVFEFIKSQLIKGRQAYVVLPLIEESEMLDYQNLTDNYEQIKTFFKNTDFKISMVHGQMKPDDKEAEMLRFKNNETQLMVATTVIEVGVNVPNASIMLIESAERFGLSQLHQLRGRVGRGAAQSYCILMTDYKLSQEARTRIETMTATNDGFKIAEVDLKLRGPGNILGTQQSGIMRFRIADIIKDASLMRTARQYAFRLLEEDFNLEQPQNQNVKFFLQKQMAKTGFWNLIG